MNHICKVTVLKTTVNEDLQKEYLADPNSGACPCFSEGQVFEFHRTPQRDDFYKFGRGAGTNGEDFPCAEAWDAISRYVYAALQGGAIMRQWTRDDRLMIACCNDGTRPVIFKIERIDQPETDEEQEWLAKQDFTNSPDSAYTG